MASSSPVPWMVKKTGISGLSFFQAWTTPSAITSVRAKAPQKLTNSERMFGFFSRMVSAVSALV